MLRGKDRIATYVHKHVRLPYTYMSSSSFLVTFWPILQVILCASLLYGKTLSIRVIDVPVLC